MSVRVLEQVFDRSLSEGTARCVLTALADAAHHDGVTWAQQGPRDNRRSLAHRARCHPSSVERAVRTLVSLGEIEVRRARRGRSWINVYRVVVGSLGEVDVQYDRLPFELDEDFSTPEELARQGARSTRQVEGVKEEAEETREAESAQGVGLAVSPSDCGGEATPFNPSNRTPSTPQIVDFMPSNASGTPYMDPSLDPSEDPSLTFSSNDEKVPAASAAGASKRESIQELIGAFSKVVETRPQGRSEWSAWSTAFAPLVDDGVTPDELTVVGARYRERWPHIDLTPFGLRKHWILLRASLIRSYFALHRWVTDISWRMPDDEAAWVIEQASSITDAQREELLSLAAQVREAHGDPGGRVLAWVEQTGWAIDDEEWPRALAGELGKASLATREPDVRRSAHDRRAELRAAVGWLRREAE